MPKAVARQHPAGGRALPWALLLPDEALSGALLPPDKMPFGTLTPPDEGLSGFGGAGGVDAADGLSECSSRAGPRADPRTAPGWPAPDGFSAYLFGPRRCALFPRRAAAGQPMSFSSCRSVASGKSVRKWSRMRTNDSAGVQSAISGP